MASPFLTKLHARFFWLSALTEPLKMGRSVLLTGLAMTGLILGLRQLGLLQGQELASYDQLIQLQPDEGEDQRLLVVGVNETDLQTLEEWPLTDRTVATLLQKLESYQPRAIGLDIMRDIPYEPGRQALLNQLNGSRRTIVVCKVSGKNDPGTPPPKGLTNKTVGFADLVVDSGGTLRRSLLMMQPPPATGLTKIRPHYCSDSSRPLISLSLQTVLKYLEAAKIPVGFTKAKEMRLGSKVFPPFQPNMGGYRNVDAEGYQLMLRYRSEEKAVKQVSVLDVLQNKVPPELIRDRIVFIGYTTPLVKDDFYTPYSGRKQDRQKMPGVVAHAQSASQLLAATLDGRSLIWVWPLPAEVAWIFAWACIGGVLAWYLRHPLRFMLVIVAVSGVIYGICFLVSIQGGWIPLVPAVAACVSTAVGVVLFDRFNSSAYGQAVYKKVKTFLKLEVEIDQEKLEKQVAEITESDYFKDLQDTVKTLRTSMPAGQQATSQGTLSQPDSSSSPLSSSILQSASAKDSDSTDDYELDFINQLKQESQALKQDSQPETADSSSQDYELDFINQLKQESQTLKSESIPPASPTHNGNTLEFIQLDFLDQLMQPGPLSSPMASLFGAQSNLSQPTLVAAISTVSSQEIQDSDDEFDFLADLKQESQRLKEGQSN